MKNMGKKFCWELAGRDEAVDERGKLFVMFELCWMIGSIMRLRVIFWPRRTNFSCCTTVRTSRTHLRTRTIWFDGVST